MTQAIMKMNSTTEERNEQTGNSRSRTRVCSHLTSDECLVFKGDGVMEKPLLPNNSAWYPYHHVYFQAKLN